jgi:hypothetical protein
MTCPEFVDLLSDRIDGEITSPQRVRLEAHLEACAGCRHRAAQMEKAVAWLRGLERLPAPTAAGRLGNAAGTRRSAWGALRPVALAASAVLAALLAWEGFDALVAPSRSASVPLTAPAGGMAAAGAPPAANPIPTSPSRPPDTLRTPATPPLEAKPAEPIDSHVDPTRPREEPTTAAGSIPAGESAGEVPIYARMHGGGSPTEDGDATANQGDAAVDVNPSSPDDRAAEPPLKQPAPVATTVWVAQPEAGASPPPAATPPPGGVGRSVPTAHTSLAPARGAAARSASIEVGTSIPVIAWVDAKALRFGDPDDPPPGELSRAGDPDPAAEGGSVSDLARHGEAIARPDADPLTGVTPPVVVERPSAVLPNAPDPEAWRLLPPLSLQVTIAADGSVMRVSPLPWPGPKWVAEALADSVRAWTFQAAERAGTAIAARLEVTIEFDAR